MTRYDIVAGDGGSSVRITIRDSVTKQPVDLTGKTMQLRWSLNGGATVERAMVPRNQTTYPGQADYAFTTADLAAGGQLKVEVRLQAGQSDQLTTVDAFTMAVKSALP